VGRTLHLPPSELLWKQGSGLLRRGCIRGETEGCPARENQRKPEKIGQLHDLPGYYQPVH